MYEHTMLQNPIKNQIKLQGSIDPYDLISYRGTTKHVKSFFLTSVKKTPK